MFQNAIVRRMAFFYISTNLFSLAERKAARFLYLLQYPIGSDRMFGLKYVKKIQPHAFGKGRTVLIAFSDHCGYSSLL